MAVAAKHLLIHLKYHHQAFHSLLRLINNGGALSLSSSGSWMKPQRVSSNIAIASVKPPRASNEKANIVSVDNDDDDGVSLGTMKLPPNTDIDRFEILLFQWANSLCQGANLPLPVPLKAKFLVKFVVKHVVLFQYLRFSDFDHLILHRFCYCIHPIYRHDLYHSHDHDHDHDLYHGLQVDKVQRGVRLGFIEVDDGKTKVLVYIDCLVFPATESSGPTFRAVRNGPLKDQVPPGEPRIMRSLLQALQKSIEIAKV